MTTTLRQAVVAQAEWVLANGSRWHYAEIRPVPIADILAGRLPISTDCSGSVIGIYGRAHAPDPSGYDYNGYGNTDSFFATCEHLASYANCEPGDLVDVTNAADKGTVHVYLVLERIGTDLKVFSHGGPYPNPPKTEMLSAVKDYWYGQGYTFVGLRHLPVVERPKYGWHIVNGRGARIGHTNHPAAWAVKHSRLFRTYGQVRFVKN